jgi:hypothetical protein
MKRRKNRRYPDGASSPNGRNGSPSHPHEPFVHREAPRFLIRLLGSARAERLSKEVVFRHRHD